MQRTDPQLARDFALSVVKKLRKAGYEAVWAGGCVRDQILGLCPKDYDVATAATPEEVRRVFGRRRTLAVGASFGVIVVLGPPNAGQVDVATFRSDVSYSDGRRPDAVRYSTAQEDALRRDFTVNGLFFDPLEERVIDYVGGQADLAQRLLRAIGNAEQRFAEDKLRMLRAVRIATIFEFEIEADTLSAIRRHAKEISLVSGERIAMEMRRMLTHRRKAEALRLLHYSLLLSELLPETNILEPADDAALGSSWHRTLSVLASLGESSFPVALAALLHGAAKDHDLDIAKLARNVGRRWRLSSEETEETSWLLSNEALPRQARQIPWPTLQRILIAPKVEDLLQLSTAIAHDCPGELAEIEFCRHKLALPDAELNPPSLLDGHDLMELGIPRGPVFQVLLERVRDEQLEGRLLTRNSALTWAKEHWQELLSS